MHDICVCDIASGFQPKKQSLFTLCRIRRSFKSEVDFVGIDNAQACCAADMHCRPGRKSHDCSNYLINITEINFYTTEFIDAYIRVNNYWEVTTTLNVINTTFTTHFLRSVVGTFNSCNSVMGGACSASLRVPTIPTSSRMVGYKTACAQCNTLFHQLQTRKQEKELWRPVTELGNCKDGSRCLVDLCCGRSSKLTLCSTQVQRFRFSLLFLFFFLHFTATVMDDDFKNADQWRSLSEDTSCLMHAYLFFLSRCRYLQPIGSDIDGDAVCLFWIISSVCTFTLVTMTGEGTTCLHYSYYWSWGRSQEQLFTVQVYSSACLILNWIFLLMDI